MNNLSQIIQEIEYDRELISKKIGITEDELNQLSYQTFSGSGGLFARSMIFNLKKSPKEILDKISGLENGNTVHYDLSEEVEKEL